MKHYVIGFAFSEDLSEVVLISKNRPAWQAGLYNGVGGHIEPGEYCIEAMIREFQEETSVSTDARDWSHICALYFPKATLDVFAIRQSNVFTMAKTNTDEFIVRTAVTNIQSAVSNVPQLIQLCIQYFTGVQE